MFLCVKSADIGRCKLWSKARRARLINIEDEGLYTYRLYTTAQQATGN